MITDLKSIFKNKLIIFIMLLLVIGSFISVYNLKSFSVSKKQYQMLLMESNLKNIARWKIHRYKRARIQDTTEDKHLYNNYVGSVEMIKKEMNELVKKLENNEEVDHEEFIKIDILNTLIQTEHFSGLYGEDYLAPMKVFPEKVDKFLKDINFEYDIHTINFLRESDEPAPFKDRIAYFTKMLETQIDSYYENKLYPNSLEYSIYNFIRNINYGFQNMWSHWMETFSIGVLPLLIFYLIDEQRKNGTIKNLYLRPVAKYKNYLYFVTVFLIISLVIVYLPIIISSIFVLITGELYDANTNVIVFSKGLSTFQTSYEEYWDPVFKYGAHGMTDLKAGVVGEFLKYEDLLNITFPKFLSYYMTIDILKILLVVLTATSISLFLKNKIIAFGLNTVIGIMLILGGKSNSAFFTNKFNPFILPNGWKLTIGREYISYYNALILLILSIIIVFVLSVIIANNKEIE